MQNINEVSPWQPSRLSFPIVFFVPLAAVLFAWNWRRLNKREWFWPAIVLSLLPLPLLYGVGFAVLTNVSGGGSDMELLLGIMPIALAAGWAYGSVFVQWYLQGGAWKQYQEKPDWDGLAFYDYPLRNGVLVFLGVLAAFPAMIAFFLTLD